jgi:hypothetical protein
MYMPANRYHFVESWSIPAPIDNVWRVLADGKLLPQWWRGVYQESVALGDYPEPRVGDRYAAKARGFLPYRLQFILETAALERPTLVSVKVAGDLSGTWTARLREKAGGTEVAIEQIVTADKPLLRWFSPLLKPLFAWNHRWTTPRGEAGLTDYLAARRTHES